MQRSIFQTTALVSTLSGLMLAPPVQAGAKIDISDEAWISVGGGFRTSLRLEEDAAPNGDDYSSDINLESIRLYVNAQVTKNISLTFNTEKDGDDDIRVLDALFQVKFSEMLNLWGGRMLPPSDRANLDGPYYAGIWDFPFAQAYPAIFAGRDNGAAIWGQTGGGKFKYQFGLFEGCDGGSGCSTPANETDNFLYAGRLTYNFWDPEPGYYTSSDYYGEKDILALAFVFMQQGDVSGTPQDSGDFLGWNIDGLMQKKLGSGGVFTVEGAYYNYDLDDKPNPALVQGDSFFILSSYLLPQPTGMGKFQPVVRYQKFDFDNGVERDRFDIGVNYIMKGHNARISLMYYREEIDGGPDSNNIVLGLQLQI